MPLDPFGKSFVEHPDLPLQIALFFDINLAPIVDNVLKPWSVIDFLRDYQTRRPDSGLDPSVVVEICRRLIRNNWLTEIAAGGVGGTGNRYTSVIRREVVDINRPSVSRLLSCGVYGFPAVYDFYSGSVLPVINWGASEDQQIGTCFVGNPHWVLTASHCITPASAFALQGATVSDLRQARFYVHPNEAMDIALILFDKPIFEHFPIPIPEADAVILDEVMALGYPNIPGFMPTLAAEAANIAGRLTATRGRVASKPMEIFARSDLFLVTARVRGGFSGGAYP